MPSSIINQVINDTYRIERLIGSGGMGSVYEASHLRIPRRFAIKLLSEEMACNKQALGRFYREAEVTSELGHDNIVEVVDYNRTARGEPYIVMELLTGEDLAHRVYRVTQLELDEIVLILKQVALAMDVVHQRGIIHRDLKPQNIFLCTRKGQDDLVKVLDFGISKIVGRQTLVTSTRTLMGSLYFIAPEQIQTSEVNYRADIYSMGCIVYTMLAGAPPFYSDENVDLEEMIQSAEPPPLGDVNPGVTDLVERVVLRALAKRPQDRYDSIGEFSDDFERAVIRGKAADFERTDLVEYEQIEAESQDQTNSDVSIGRRVMSALATNLEDNPQIETISLDADELEPLSDVEAALVDEEAPTPGALPRIPALDPQQAVEVADAAQQKWVPVRTVRDPITARQWPPQPDDPDNQPTSEWQNVSAALSMMRADTNEVERVKIRKLKKPDTARLLRVMPGGLSQADTDSFSPPPAPPPVPADHVDDLDEDTTTNLIEPAWDARERVPTDELVPTKVVWDGEVHGAPAKEEEPPGQYHDVPISTANVPEKDLKLEHEPGLFHDVHISTDSTPEEDLSLIRRLMHNAGIAAAGAPEQEVSLTQRMFIWLSVGAVLALLAWLGIFLVGQV